MNVLQILRQRFSAALDPMVAASDALAEMVLPSQDPRFGDYQANCAMPLSRQLSRSPREVARELVERLEVADLCHPPEVAGPGFINLRLRDEWLADRLQEIFQDEDRLGVPAVAEPRTVLLDYSAPNVAKPMHVGHIRSTVIGDSLNRLLRFVGHQTISDNHIGDWGTQFGMIIYGYKHLLDRPAYEAQPVHELGRLYRLVRQLVDYHATRRRLPELEGQAGTARAAAERLEAEPLPADPRGRKRAARERKQALARWQDLEQEAERARRLIAAVDQDAELAPLAASHPEIGSAVLRETALLHQGDAENRSLWQAFLPPCLEEIGQIYRRLGVSFDHTLGESSYHDRLAATVTALEKKGLATESDGALCVFLDQDQPPLIIRKKDGAFLYATTDLATLQYRVETFHPQAILYVVDHRQALHFQQLFAAARRWGYDQVELTHVRFGTVLGEDGRPFKTRSGDTVGLAGLLDEAVARAEEIVAANDQAKPQAELSPGKHREVAEVVGIGALKYADLAQNRESDYVFSYDKMLAMKGNTATYLQYSYARVQSIFEKGRVARASFRSDNAPIEVAAAAERALALALLRFPEGVARAVADYRPNHLTAYLFELASRFAEFFEQCPVLRAENASLRTSRLKLCDLTGRTIRLGLSLLGIGVVEKM